jgi:hypothetical protein
MKDKKLPLHDALFENCQTITESVNGKKNWYIKGVFAQAGITNRNGRLYEKEILDSAVNEYNKNFIKTRRAVGELSHPDTTKINPDRITHLTEEIIIQGNYYIGKAKILDTYWGKHVQALLEGGVQLAVSTRADGSTRERADGVQVVNPGLILRAVDIVYDPSAPEAFVESLMEGVIDWDTSDPDVAIAEEIRQEIRRTSSNQLNETYLQVWNKLMNSCING